MAIWSSNIKGRVCKMTRLLKRHQSPGFTIIEVLIAMVLLSMIMVYSITSIDNNTQITENVISEDRELMSVVASLERINMDIVQIYSPLYYSYEKRSWKEGERAFVPSDYHPSLAKNNIPIPRIHHPDNTSLIFYTAANRRKLENSKESTYAWIRYSLREQKDSNKSKQGLYELVRQSISHDPYTGDYDWDEVREQVLIPHVKDLEFFFWDGKTKEFVSSLEETSQDLLIRGIKIKLTWIDSFNKERIAQRFYRPLWPWFSGQKEELEYEKQQQQQNANKKETGNQKRNNNQKDNQKENNNNAQGELK